MPVRKRILNKSGLYFITFTCHNWIPLIEYINGYDLVYKWFDYLQAKGHRITGYVIMPNHLHAMIDFVHSEKQVNKIIGDGKRFIAYEIINRLKKAGQMTIIKNLQRAVSGSARQKGKIHQVWIESFDWKSCETARFVYQKLIYMHNNPCRGKWRLVKDITEYEHSSARFYICRRHAGYEVVDVEIILFEKREGPESTS